MSIELACPICAERFQDEDFCPKHGVRLTRFASTSTPHAGPAVVGDPPIADSNGSQAESAIPTEDAPSAADRESESKILKFMSRLKLRPLSSKPNSNESEQSPRDASGAPVSPLPSAILEQGWTIAGPVQTTAGVDRWPTQKVTDSGQTAGLLQRYRTGALTADSTYRRLEEANLPSLAKVLAHGTVNFGGARADYDLVVVPTCDRGLDKWFAESPPSEQRAMHVLPLIVHLLREMDTIGIRPMVIEPSQLIRPDDGKLCMISVGALAEAAAPAQYRPEFTRSALLPLCWVAPELVQQSMLSANAAIFSLGQLLAQALWGQPCSHEEVQSGAVPFHAIQDARLARVLMGCLWPRSTGRWTYEELFQALECATCETMPASAPWSSLVPGASSRSFSFAGESFWRLEELLVVATKPSSWPEATHNIKEILDWAESTAWAGQARLLREALCHRRSPDWVLVAFARAVRPDAPITWRELDLSDAEAARSLASLAQNALQGSETSAQAVQDLFNADLRNAFSQQLAMP